MPPNPKLLQQLALADQAGDQQMAKSFFAKTPGAGGPADDSSVGPGGADDAGAQPSPGILGGIDTNKDASNAPGGDAGGDAAGGLPPELLEELLRLIEGQGGGAGGGQQQG